jgi:hypothetical protein
MSGRKAVVYSNTKRQIIGILNGHVIWSVVVSNFLIAILFLVPALSGTRLGQVLAVFEILVLVWYCFWLYKLSFAVNPSKGEAWSMLLVQVIPLFGLFFTVMLIVKARRISKDVSAPAVVPDAVA